MRNTAPEVRGKAIHVVAGVIFSPARDRVLIARRPEASHQGGLWEFPGGKLSEGELPLAALSRELREELAIEVTRARPFLEIHHNYPDRVVFLDIWQVDEFTGQAKGNEGQPIAWVGLEELENYAFPAANEAIIERLLGR